MAETKKKQRPRVRIVISLGAVTILLIIIALLAARQLREDEPFITSDMLGQQLKAAEQLVSVEYHYTNVGKFEDQWSINGFGIPFTTKQFIVSYDGVIKAGIDLGQVEIEVNDDSHVVSVALPECKIISHEIPEDSIQLFDESRNIFNQISIEDYTGFTKEQKAVMEQKAADNGFMASAEENARASISAFLSLVPGMEEYKIVFK